jgi:anti-sigma factor RsiW
MTCHELIEFLDRYVEETVSEEERREFDRHLAVCPACVAYVDGYRATIELTRTALAAPDDLVPGTVPEELVAAVLAARRKR